jgi:EmrB/QacA subfamily drug resistance transporter
MAADSRSKAQRNLALLVAATFFMESLDGTIITTAAPSIAEDFGLPSVAVGVTISAYLLAVAVVIPLSGWLSVRFGARRIFLGAIVVFTVASVLCALSTNLAELTAMRVLQGVGGAMMVPVGRLSVLRVTDKVDLVRTIALLTWPALTAPVIAPLVGGVITTYASWHWIFLINVPLGVGAFVVARRLVPASDAEPGHPLDWVGAVLVSLGLGALVSASSLLAGEGSDPVVVVGLGVIAVGCIAAAVVHLLRRSVPLLQLRTLRVASFRLSNSAGGVFRATVSAVPFLLPLLFQDAFGWSPVLAGSLVLFLFFGNVAIKPATTAILRVFGFRATLAFSTAGLAVTMVVIAFAREETPLPALAVLLFASGVFRSIGFTAYNTIAFADVAATDMSDANTLASTLQQLAASLGVALGALLLSAGAALQGAEASYSVAFLALAGLTLLSGVEIVASPKTLGAEIRPGARR